MRPRLAFAALLTTSLVAVAIPAAAGSSDTSATSPDVGTLTQQTSPSPAPSASASPGTQTSATTATAADPTATPTPTATASSSDPLTCLQSAASNPLAIFNCASAGGANPLTALVSQIQSAASGSGAPSLSPAPVEAFAACVQTNLTASPPDAAKVEGCFSTFAQTITGAQQAKCLDPILQGVLGGLEGLVTTQSPTPLQTELAALQGQLTALPTCLSGTGNTPVTTGTTTSSGGATTPATTTSDPTEAVPVAATPNFTG